MTGCRAIGHLGNLLTDELSELEQLTLIRLAKGKKPEEIADAENISASAIHTRLSTIRSKLGAETTIQAVVMALTAGIIE